MASRKACGEDGVPAEILKLSPDSFQENLRLLINSVFASEFKMPKETLSAKVILLYKKGDPSLLVNYRPIALLTSTYQLMNLILAGRLQDLAERNGLFESPSSVSDGYTGLQTVSKNSSPFLNLRWRWEAYTY
jgi:hypothetical protein